MNNNPLSAVDPNGGDGKGQGGDKVISIFLDYGVKDLGRQVTRDSRTGKLMSDVPNTPSDWQGTKAAGYSVQLFGRPEVTGEKGLPQLVSDRAFNNALQNSDVVIYVGHGRSGDPNREPFRQDGIQLGGTYYTPTGTGSASPFAQEGTGPFTGPKPEVTASLVLNLSCDADRNGGAYFKYLTDDGQKIFCPRSRKSIYISLYPNRL